MNVENEIPGETNEWDFDGAVHFVCSQFIWSRDKTKLRISVTSKEMLIEHGFNGKVVDAAPEEFVMLQFNEKQIETLRQFINGSD